MDDWLPQWRRLVFVRIHDDLVIEVDLIFFPIIIASEIDIPKDMEENGDDDEEEPSPESAGTQKFHF